MNKHIYTIGQEIRLKDEKRYTDFILSQSISKEDYLRNMESTPCLELKYEKNKLINIKKSFQEGEMVREQVIKPRWFFNKFNYIDFPPNEIEIKTLTEQATGSFLGGTPSDGNFIFPKARHLNFPFQHIAELELTTRGADLGFDKLNIVYPVFATMEKLYLDYSNPNHPKVLNDHPELVLDYTFGEHDETSELIFEKRYLETIDETIAYDKNDLLIGVPLWLQTPTYPASPITKKKMTFLAQIRSNKKVKTEKCTIETTYDYFERYNSYLNFGGDGVLYIFYEAETKLLCLIAQVR